MSNKLKIYACSGIGDQEQPGYWLDDTRTSSNTQAVNNLLSMINEKLSELYYLQLSKTAEIERYNAIDLLVVCLRFAKRYAGQSDMLRRAGRVIGSYAASGSFDTNDTNDDSRSAHLDILFAAILDDLDNSKNTQSEPEFDRWFEQQVVALNQVGLSAAQQAAADQWAVDQEQRVGATDYGDISEYLNNSQDYFLYLYIPDSEVGSWSKSIQTKRKKQQEVYQYCLKIFRQVYGDESAMQRIIRSSIIRTFGATPEQVLDRLRRSGSIGEPITLTAAAIVEIIIAVVGAIASIIGAILTYCAKVAVAKYQQPVDAESGIPDQEDFAAVTNEKSLILLFGLSALLLCILAGKRKKTNT